MYSLNNLYCCVDIKDMDRHMYYRISKHLSIISQWYKQNKYSKTSVKWPLKNRQNKDLNDKW